MVLIEFSMFPLDKGESLSSYVARILDIIDQSGIPYRLNPMGTVLEGDYDEVMAVVRKCFKALEKDCNRISMTLKMDYRKTDQSRLESKIKKVESILKKELKK
ncbi:MAG TPA: MTH1187 family thiamine-binding protein [Caldithrix abyssi]|uniref:MTH1187 family thiamine-binding protein n=1 Tax=Caldithrix abyssi TaxID=187145 RepID=A0A7V5H2N7_CALAY|nr:MTH1187 family thiamine-binding protein [Caldisericaceae bacterium]HHE54455.1 MTH1187 family thiamine-binding protein [Caldithrix abyssi]